MTGDVKTGFWSNASGSVSGLPASSPYAPIGSHVEKMMRGETNPPGQHSRERWAAAVVGDILRPTPGRFVRRGFVAWTMMIVSLLLPVWLMDWAFTKAAKLDELKHKLQLKDTKKAR